MFKRVTKSNARRLQEMQSMLVNRENRKANKLLCLLRSL